MKLFTVLAIFGTSISAHAAVYTPLYKCFNQAQMLDDPIVSIVQDSNSKQYVELENRGGTSYVALSYASTLVVDGEHLGANGIDVVEKNGVEEPPAGATVTLESFGLTYNCTPARN